MIDQLFLSKSYPVLASVLSRDKMPPKRTRPDGTWLVNDSLWKIKTCVSNEQNSVYDQSEDAQTNGMDRKNLRLGAIRDA